MKPQQNHMQRKKHGTIMAGYTMASSLLLVAAMAAAISLAHADENPPAIFSFGDSLSDVGNNNYLPPGAFKANYPHWGVDFTGGVATGRFTNGYNIIDILAQHMGFKESPPAYEAKTSDTLTGVNYASGGAGFLVDCVNGTIKQCFTMWEQIDNFKSTRLDLQQRLGREAAEEFISKSILIFSDGGNDIYDFFLRHNTTSVFRIDEFVANLTSAFKEQLKELYDLGGRKFAIINVVALGDLPKVRFDGSDVRNLLTSITQKFNGAEDTMLKELSSTLPGMKYSIGNFFNAIKDLFNHPDEHGFKNATSACCGEIRPIDAPPFVLETPCTPEASLCSDRSEYVFFDVSHPTQSAMEYTGEKFYSGNLNYASPINLKQLVEDHVRELL